MKLICIYLYISIKRQLVLCWLGNLHLKVCGTLSLFRIIVCLHTWRGLSGYSVLYYVFEACFSIHCWYYVGILRLAVVFLPFSTAFRVLAVTPAGARRLIFRVRINLCPVEDIVIWWLKQVLACCGKQKRISELCTPIWDLFIVYDSCMEGEKKTNCWAKGHTTCLCTILSHIQNQFICYIKAALLVYRGLNLTLKAFADWSSVNSTHPATSTKFKVGGLTLSFGCLLFWRTFCCFLWRFSALRWTLSIWTRL